MTDREKRLQALRDKRDASGRMGPGYAARIAAINAEIEKLERDDGAAE